jgi:hypothetical protein
MTLDLPDIYATELRLRYGRLLKRSGQYDHATAVLDPLHGEKDIRVLIQLAKVLEHQTRDYESALQWTSLAMEKLIEISRNLPEYKFNQQNSELVKRKDRLIQKIQTTNGQKL